ncbi:D-isomer-specific 2-hydroxyacid dehydrogenase-like protein [Westerdykella ornata]|uniref:D-isomer-specific 2-hydroxyacid dehydrogenase-like protein n=1 Tax=Westerdykella ornata TaxID=318751 RepID=A0A6A6J896_WESOR|nr:D-isomer-specific 2-hydroxyacid dehydrogenase-like protein [Westerdykella ornata]KAF2272383.1 D-isomer-specific 2-hydroxyacid dehydrogenase-like protein [Westerdykella ornata]
MSQKAALLIGKLDHTRKEWEEVGQVASKLYEYPDGSRSDFIDKCRNGEFNGVFAMFRSNESNSITGNFDEELVEALPSSLKFICHNGAGYDNIDVAACTKRGIQVSSTPIAVNDATADVAMFLILGALRNVTQCFQAVRQGRWRGNFKLGHDPRNKILGILGMGGIGSAVATRAKAFGMKIQYHNRNRLPENEENGATYVSFEELLKTSDVLSLNLALNKSTRHIIAKPQFDMMKDGIVIVNTARGPLIDEAALVDALNSGKVSTAGLDVFEEEPKIHQGLLDNENVVLLPHIGTATFETQRDMELLVLDNLKSALKEEKLLTQVPEQRK